VNVSTRKREIRGMRLALLKERTMEPANEPKLTAVDRLAPVVEWPYGWPATTSESVVERSPVRVTAELQTKRFRDRDVENNRYTAELTAASNSTHAILAALTEACGKIDELLQSSGGSEPFIFEIRLRG
jgi:hypothetical protein